MKAERGQGGGVDVIKYEKPRPEKGGNATFILRCFRNSCYGNRNFESRN